MKNIQALFLGFKELYPLTTVPRLWQVEAWLWAYYVLRSPPIFIWKYGRKLNRPFGDFRYGETPWCTGVKLLNRCHVTSDDRFLDLGCGRGKMVFLAHLLTGAQAKGVDLIPVYIDIALSISARMNLNQVDFKAEDLLHTDLSHADVIYFAGSAFSEQSLSALEEKLPNLKPGTKLISVGWKPQQVLEAGSLHPDWEEEYIFSWGWEKVYCYSVPGSGNVTQGL